MPLPESLLRKSIEKQIKETKEALRLSDRKGSSSDYGAEENTEDLAKRRV